ncbi:MAG: hypothetical protein A2X59_00475 [Nitrospirae bacterium GWC2_42_7]|nr:MAG: hypothetical protein A2X59_00475 [Nitrospirae bacterium GWC2_42_7]
MNDIKRIKHLIILLSILAGLIFWILDALIDRLMFYDKPFLEILSGNANEMAFRLLTCLFFLGFGLFAARTFCKQKKLEIELRDEITQYKITEDALRSSEDKYRSLVESTNDSIYLVDKDLRYLYINKNHITRMGFKGEEYLGRSYNEFHLPEEIKWFTKNVNEIFSTGHSVQFEHKSFRDGRYFFQTLSPVKDSDGKIMAVTVISKDINDLKEMEHKLHALSNTDELTGLLNRRGFFSMSGQPLKLANRKKTGVFLLFVDLDGLKSINDNFGHTAGDSALIEISLLLKKSFRDSDVIARIGGDEFVVFPVETAKENISTIIDRFQERIDRHNEKTTLAYKLSASVGVAYYDPEKPSSLDELLLQADSNMYEQKSHDLKF